MAYVLVRRRGRTSETFPFAGNVGAIRAGDLMLPLIAVLATLFRPTLTLDARV